MADTVPDRRVERSKAAVLTETYRQLIENGMGGVSIDDIARRSGVAKTTIYRHWPSRSALLIDACSRIGNPQDAPDTGSLAGDLRLLTATVAEQLRSAAWPSVLPSIIDAAERDPEIATLQARLHEGNMAPFRTVAARALARGEIPPAPVAEDVVAADLIAAVLGPLFYRRWFSKEAIDDRFVDAVIGNAVAAVTAATAAAAAPPLRRRQATERSSTRSA